MVKSFCHVLALAMAFSLVMFPGSVLAQGSGIAGEVVDSSGAVLPGVTVEAASPALIEQVRNCRYRWDWKVSFYGPSPRALRGYVYASWF